MFKKIAKIFKIIMKMFKKVANLYKKIMKMSKKHPKNQNHKAMNSIKMQKKLEISFLTPSILF